MFLADFHFGIVVGACVGERNLQVGVGDFAVGHHFKVLENLHVALVGVHDHIKICVGTEHVGEHFAERFLKHAYHGGLVDVFQLFEL